MITGTIAVSELGGPMRPSPFGPSQPSAPTIHVSEKISPASVSSMSERVRVKTSSSTAISTSARPISGAIPSSVAFLYSSSTTTGDRLLTRSGPSSAAASSLILRSASWTLSSPVSISRMLAIATGVPSVSVPVIAARAAWSSGALRTPSICAWVTEPKSSVCRAAPIRAEGATKGLAGASSSLTLGSPMTAPVRAAIWESPPGVSASPRKRRVTMLTSPDSLKSSAISPVALATGCPGGRKATSAPSVGGARSVEP